MSTIGSKTPLECFKECVSIIYSFLSRFCRRCFHCDDDCEINLACTGKVVRLYVKSQKWPSESTDLHFICLIMHPNRHFIMHHTQSNKLALLDFNKTCGNRSNHNSSWVKAHADCIRTTIMLLTNNHVHLCSVSSICIAAWYDKCKQSAIYMCHK